MIKGIFFTTLFFAYTFITGNAFLKYIGWKRSICSSYAFGFAFMLAVFQIPAYIMFRAGTSFMLLFWVYSAILFIMLTLSFFINSKDKPYKEELQNLKLGIKQAPVLFLLTVIALAAILFMSEGFYYSSSDDGYYITRSLEAIAQNKLNISEDMAWYGRTGTGLPDYKDCSTLIFFVAYLSKISGIQATILSKTFFLFNLLIAHFAAVMTAADAIFWKRENIFQKKCLFLILYILFQALATKEGSAGTWMTGYLWEGKAVLIAVIFPLLIASCLTLFRRIETLNNKEWLSLLILMLAGIALSIIGVFLPVILYFTLGLAILIGDKFRNFKKIWKPALITVIPVIIFAGLSYFSVATATNLLDRGTIAGASEKTSLISAWISQFFYGCDFWQIALYALSVIYILIKGTKPQKVILVLAPVILILTFLNPLLSSFVSTYITSPIVYWRLFWLFPVYLLPAIVLADIAERIMHNRIQQGVLAIILILGIIAGFEVFRYSVTATEYTIKPFITNIGKLFNVRPELRFNIYNLNPAPLNVAKMVEDDWDKDERPSLLFCFNRPYEVRLYSENIELTSAVRNYHLQTNKIPGTDIIESDFILSYSEIKDAAYLKDILQKMNVNYIAFDGKSKAEGLEENGFEYIGNSCELIDLWKVNY